MQVQLMAPPGTGTKPWMIWALSGQDRHSVAPAPVSTVDAGQRMHGSSEVEFENVPSAHWAHSSTVEPGLMSAPSPGRQAWTMTES